MYTFFIRIPLVDEQSVLDRRFHSRPSILFSCMGWLFVYIGVPSLFKVRRFLV